jgi:TonB family protein
VRDILLANACVLQRDGCKNHSGQKEKAMTLATPDPSSNTIVSIFSSQNSGLYPARREAFISSLLGQAIILAVFALLAAVSRHPGVVVRHASADSANLFPIIFSGPSGGGGGGLDRLPASHGDLPRASLDDQLAPPTVIVPKEMPKLPVEPTVVSVPEINLATSNVYGDPLAKLSNLLSNGTGGPGGTGEGCCNGVGPSHGPGVGPGPGGIYLAGVKGVTVTRIIYNPEPSFSDEARKAKAQGRVILILVVGTDGHTHDLRVQSSLGMGLDEKALDAVRTWGFLPATLNGQPVAAQIAVEVDFHLY